jgi:polyhydroxyalkanoate synthase
MFWPLNHWGAGPGKQVAIVGMGGLGHMGVKIAHALGAEVTVLSQTLSKEEDGKRLGADHYHATSDDRTFEELANSFDLIVNTVAANLDDTDFLAQIEAVDRFTANMIAYPGRTFGQLYHRILKGNQLATGVVRMDDKREISLADIRLPVLVFAGESDGIAPVKSIQPMVDLLSNATSVRFEIVPGGHLGMLTGRASRRTTWRIIDEFLDEHTSVPDVPTKKAATKKAAGNKPAAAKKAAAKKAPAKRAPRADAIGANPARRYGSASSRSLAAPS